MPSPAGARIKGVGYKEKREFLDYVKGAEGGAYRSPLRRQRKANPK